MLYLRPHHLGRIEDRVVRSAPEYSGTPTRSYSSRLRTNIVVEVSSPSTRRLELWYVDLDADRVEIHRMKGERYGTPALARRGEALASPQMPGFAMEVADVLGDAPKAT